MEEKECAPPQKDREDVGKLEYGCKHYQRRCNIRAPCCDKIFPCRHCHNEAVSHELVRRDVKTVAPICSNCGIKMGEYFCDICKFYDDDTSKGQFHCDDCGICRVGGRDKFFHCQKCGSCYTVSVRNNHVCVENSMKNYCPVCYEYLFDSTKGSTVMKCGHTMHSDCFDEMADQNQYRCPICSKTVLNMSNYWLLLDMEIEANKMPDEYQYDVSILCNNCNSKNKAPFHILVHKCKQCNSYNTRRISTPGDESDAH